MTRRVIWSPVSRADLVQVSRHIARDNPTAARSVAVRLRAAGEALGERPTGRPGRVSGTYEKVVPGLPYVIAYELIPHGAGEEAIAILHVIHSRRNWPAEEWPTD